MAKKIRFHADGSPVEIPWPTEGEWATGTMHALGTNKCCINGWLFFIFTGSPRYRPPLQLVVDIPSKPVEMFARKVAAKANEMARSMGFPSTVDFNNDPDTTDAMRTEFWAELWGAFGYEECK